jgi:ABC-type transport system involved in multi-copper enzyme maturation permease subunit
MIALMLSALASTFLGGLLVSMHQRTGARDESAARERIGLAARTSSASVVSAIPGAGTSSTASVTAFDLAAWSDTFIARGATSPSGFVANDLAALPDSAAIRVYEPPSMVPSLAERSPAAIILGALDLAWILALVLPLAAIALGFDSVARDREKGTLAMLLAPARTGAPLVRARMLASATVLWLGIVPAAIVGGVAESIITGLAIAPGALVALFVLLTGYIVFLAAAVTAVSALSDRSATALAVLIAGWLVFFVAVPLAMSAIVRAAYPMPDPRARLDGELAAQDVFQRPSAAILDEQAEKDRALDPSLGKDGISIQNRYYMLLSRERYHRAKAARYEEETALLHRVELAEISAWLSPATIISNAMAALADTTPHERIDFAKDGDRYRANLEAFVRDRVVANENRFQDAEAWPRFVRVLEPDRVPSLVAAALFFLLGAIAIVVAGAIFDRMELAPTREDA